MRVCWRREKVEPSLAYRKGVLIHLDSLKARSMGMMLEEDFFMRWGEGIGGLERRGEDERGSERTEEDIRGTRGAKGTEGTRGTIGTKGTEGRGNEGNGEDVRGREVKGEREGRRAPDETQHTR